MKKIVKVIVPAAVVVVVAMLIAKAVSYSNSKFERSIIVRDSIAKEEVYQDSVRAAEKKNQKLEEIRLAEEKKKSLEEAERKYLPLMKVEKDEFDDCEWIYPKSRPAYINTNSVYCYFAKYDDGKVGNFRFKFQYADKNWLFIENMKFNIDGVNYTLTPNMKRDHNTTIWEWCDEGVGRNSSSGVTWSFIRALADAKNAKVRLEGMNYNKDKVVSSAEMKAIKNTLDYYQALGGITE